LLTHRSGLGLGAGDLLWLHSDYPRDSIVRRIRYAKSTTSFRSAYAYDNVLYVVAGQLLPPLTGITWDDFIRTRIFAPLGMSETFTSLAKVTIGADMATPHSLDENGKIAVATPDTVENAAPAGSIVSNVLDMARWVTTLLDSGRIAGGQNRLVSAQRIKEMWTGQTILPIDELPAEQRPLQPKFNQYGLGFVLRDYRGHRVVTHTGGLNGMTSRVLMIPDLELGIIVLTNSSSRMYDAIAYRIVDEALGVPATNWTDILVRAARAKAAKADSTVAAARGTRDASSRPSLALARYAGRYEDVMYGHATITIAKGANGKDQLTLRFEHSPLISGPLEHWQYDTFIARFPDRDVPEAYVTFTLTADGKIREFTMKPVSPLADFSFDYQDLLFKPVDSSR
jgi:CubicO group peptidase (beta-lactamase class C family)